MTTLNVEFEKLRMSTFAYQDERRQTTEQQAQHHMINILAHLKSVSLLAKRTPKSDVLLFVDQNKGSIYNIYFLLAKDTSRYMSDKLQQRDLSLKVLRLMRMLHISNVKKFFERLPADYLTDFCNGITYFNGDEISKPAFLGIGGLPFEQMLSKSSQVYKCYLERIIYDKMFSYILSYQDTQHLEELNQMEYFYKNIFKDCRISVFIFYKNAIEPVSLILTTYTNANCRDKIEELYDKTSSGLVKCTKAVFKDDKRVAYYTKEQTEDREVEWIKLD